MADEVDASDLLEELDLDDVDTGDLEILLEEFERQGLGRDGSRRFKRPRLASSGSTAPRSTPAAPLGMTRP